MAVRGAEARLDEARLDEAPVGAPRVVPRGDAAALAEAMARTRPVSLAREHTLPVVEALQDLVPGAALARGSTVGVVGTSLALALAAGPSRAGSWVALVGLPWLGLGAVAGLGLALERVAVVAPPEPSSWATVTAALVGAFDLVVVAEPARVGAADARRLAARARERGTVLVRVLPSPAVPGPAVAGGSTGAGRLEVDLRLAVTATRWEGLGHGHGHLRARRVRVEATGRRRAARPRTADLWLPAVDGTVRAVVGSGPGRSSGRSADRGSDRGSDAADRRPSLRVVGGAAPPRADQRRVG
ncbi:MAG: hypothetical protein U0Q07_19710 [Acidimicrobiales bacterium]